MKHVLLAAALLAASPAAATSLRFVESKPTAYDFADIPAVPAGFGVGEFSLEMWVKPDERYPVGPVWRAGYNQLKNWSEADPEPYSSDGWWLSGNWLLDGHTRPEGFGAGDTREGTFSLQFYGGGRLRWMFADGKDGMPKGMVHAVQAWPAEGTPSLLDGKWHHVVAVRRWREPAGATLELWIDGKRVAATEIATRTDMSRLWSKLSHPRDPVELGGWALGSEVMTAWNYALTQYEDYKGLLDDLGFWGRALTPQEIATRAAGRTTRETGLLAHFGFDEGRGEVAKDSRGSGVAITLHRMGAENWSTVQRK
ncbi:LamG domain-containing protein [Sphingoaurantiacus capsulatus]|uniref:LamG domain-containing protein n=1 Tax=Sphingoaurantiacus capsulatus TaxID=1771310 RepID=A0ABV7X511_9SPHN